MQIIKKKIQQRGMTLAEVAAKMNVAPPTLTSIIKSDNPKFKSLQGIADAIGITVSELLMDDDCTTHTTIVCPECGAKIQIEVKKQSE